MLCVGSRRAFALLARSHIVKKIKKMMSGTTSSSGVGGRLDISGVYPPIATPFDNDENVDYDKLLFNLQRWNDIPFKGSYKGLSL